MIPFPTGVEHKRALTYTVEEVAKLLSVTPGVVRQAIRADQIPAIQVGRFWRIPIQRFHEEVLGEERGS